MNESTKTTATEAIVTTNSEAFKDGRPVVTTAREVTKDAGRVRFGDGYMRF